MTEIAPRFGTQIHRLVFEGATSGELASMFNLSGNTIRKRLTQVKPSGSTHKGDLWMVGDAAPYLVSPVFDATHVDRLLRMNAKDLPPQLQKAFWDGKNAEVSYLERIGDLWDSKTVVELASDTFKTLRLSLILLTDAVERESGLNEAQRAIIIRLVNASLEEMRRKLIDGFNERRARTHGEPGAPSEAGRDEDL